MLLNVDQLQKQLDKDKFQEDGSMTAFWVVNNQFQKFINSKFTLDYDSQMTDTYFVEYTGLEVQHFRDTLLQHLGNVKKSVAERTHSTVQDDSSRSGNDTDADDADIRPIYDEEPMAEVQLTAECNIFAIGQQHTEQPEIVLSKTTEQTRSLLANNAELKAQIQEKVFAIAALKNDLRKLKGNSVDTKFDKTSVLGKPVLPSLRNQSVVRQPNAFKSARVQMSKQRFASQVDVNKNLSKPVTQHYLPKKTESTFAKPDHMIASSSSRNSSKNMPRFSSNDMNSIFGQDVDTFTRTMLLNVDQLQKQLDKDEFQEDGSMTAFWVVHTLRYITPTTLGNVKKSVAERTRHQRQYDRWVNKIHMQEQESKIDTVTALDANLVDIERHVGTDSQCKMKLAGQSMAAEKADISKTIVKVDSQMMIQKNDVCSQQFRPQTSMSNDVCSQQFRPQNLNVK
ncbi:hypothetical protein Tco_1174643 [Tanacetum coccineum]